MENGLLTELVKSGAVLIAAVIGVIASVLISLRAHRVDITKTQLSQRELKSRAEASIGAFRQQWIQDLRDAMAKFHSIAFSRSLAPHYEEGAEPMTLEDRERLFYFADLLQLLMNSQDPNYGELMMLVNSTVRSVCKRKGEKNNDRTTFNELAKLDDAFIGVCQKILKSEWEVLKREIRKSAT